MLAVGGGLTWLTVAGIFQPIFLLRNIPMAGIWQEDGWQEDGEKATSAQHVLVLNLLVKGFHAGGRLRTSFKESGKKMAGKKMLLLAEC